MAGEEDTPNATADETLDAAPDTVDWHLFLLGLAGRVSDAVIARCRGLLADRPTAEIGPALTIAALDEAVPLFGAEVDFLGDTMGWTDETDELLSRVTTTESGVPLGYGFAAEPPEDSGNDETGAAADRAAVERAAAQAGAIGLWRSWRLPTGNSASPQARPVYVVEADEHADLISITAEIQRALEATGLEDPQVEVYPTGYELPSYQRFARSYGELMWSRTPDPGVQIAVLFDEVDPTLGPRFREDHPTADDEEWPKLVEYLRRGEPLLITTARLDDVVDTARGNVVPMSFRTDGTWVWSDATTYYLEAYRLLPDAEMVTHIRALGHVPPVVDDVAMHRAMAALQEPATEEPAWTFGG